MQAAQVVTSSTINHANATVKRIASSDCGHVSLLAILSAKRPLVQEKLYVKRHFIFFSVFFIFFLLGFFEKNSLRLLIFKASIGTYVAGMCELKRRVTSSQTGHTPAGMIQL
jgi:hypothetical protein